MPPSLLRKQYNVCRQSSFFADADYANRETCLLKVAAKN
jgi:hypothetical protein